MEMHARTSLALCSTASSILVVRKSYAVHLLPNSSPCFMAGFIFKGNLNTCYAVFNEALGYISYNLCLIKRLSSGEPDSVKELMGGFFSFAVGFEYLPCAFKDHSVPLHQHCTGEKVSTSHSL